MDRLKNLRDRSQTIFICGFFVVLMEGTVYFRGVCILVFKYYPKCKIFYVYQNGGIHFCMKNLYLVEKVFRDAPVKRGIRLSFLQSFSKKGCVFLSGRRMKISKTAFES